MGLFNRKKKTTSDEKPLELPTLAHEHTWKDMPWYMEVEYSGTEKWAKYRIVEPYICVTCGERKDVTLEKENWTNIDSTTRDEYYQKIRKRYRKYLKPRAVVEDMINNILLVKSPEYLEMVETMRGLPHKNCGTSAEMKQVKEPEYKITLPERPKK